MKIIVLIVSLYAISAYVRYFVEFISIIKLSNIKILVMFTYEHFTPELHDLCLSDLTCSTAFWQRIQLLSWMLEI